MVVSNADMSASPSSSSSSSYSDENIGEGCSSSRYVPLLVESARGASANELLLCSPERIQSFWEKMGADDSPVKVHHPFEHRCYRALSSAPKDLLGSFAQHLEESLSKCLVSAGGRPSSNADRRSVLLGHALSELRNNVSLRRLIVSILCLVAEDISCFEDDDCVGSIVASTANDQWCDRGRPPSPTAASVSFPALSAEERDKVSYHCGWAIKRVRENIIVCRKPYCAFDREGSDQFCSREELLDILKKLGEDVFDADSRRHYFQPNPDVASFFEHLHGIAQGLLSDKVSTTYINSICLCIAYILNFFTFQLLKE